MERKFALLSLLRSPGGRQSKLISTLVFLLFGSFAAYEISQYLLANDWDSLGLMAVGLAGLAFAVKILNDWRQGLYIFFGWLFFEDLARKYLGNNPAIFFAKDVLVILVYVSFYLARRGKKEKATFRPPFFAALMVLVWFAFAQMFNPNSTSVLYGLLGMKLYFLYLPLMFLGYALMDSEQELRRFFLFSTVLVLVAAALGVAQSIIGPTFLNPVTIQEDIRELSTLYRVSPITGQVAYRPTSVFVSVGRFQDLIVMSWIVLIGFGGYLILRIKKNRTVAFLTIGVLAGTALMSTSRGVVMWCGGSSLVIVAAFVWGAPWRQREATRVVRSIQRIVLLGGVAVILLAVTFPEEVNSRLAIYSETLSPYSTASELAFRARDYPLQNFLAAFDTDRWIYGYGTGTASLGIQYIVRVLRIPGTGVSVENGYGQLVIEMGIFGLAFWLFWGVAVCSSGWKIVKQLKGSPWFPVAFAIFWLEFLILFPMGYNSIAFFQDFLVNAYFWVLLGVLFRLPSLALSAQFAAEDRAKAKAYATAVALPHAGIFTKR